jgi:hypothetical protein
LLLSLSVREAFCHALHGASDCLPARTLLRSLLRTIRPRALIYGGLLLCFLNDLVRCRAGLRQHRGIVGPQEKKFNRGQLAAVLLPALADALYVFYRRTRVSFLNGL